jgi:hypothetical protein
LVVVSGDEKHLENIKIMTTARAGNADSHAAAISMGVEVVMACVDLFNLFTWV